LLTIVQTERVSIVVMVLFPSQTEPENWHQQVGDYRGEEENERIISLKVYF
jgi:hypothetical protein